MNPTLDQLAKKFNTDKGSMSHFYTRWYAQILDAKRYDVLQMLELGIGDGASLKMWEMYFPLATIYGLDINVYESKSERIIPFNFSQTDEQTLKQTFADKKLDLIIDDACHEPPAIMLSLRALFNFLTPGGYYVIEDLNGAFIKDVVDFSLDCKQVKSLQIFSTNETSLDPHIETIIFIQKI